MTPLAAGLAGVLKSCIQIEAINVTARCYRSRMSAELLLDGAPFIKKIIRTAKEKSIRRRTV